MRSAISQIINYDLSSELLFDKHSPLYHYTSPEGFMGITNENLTLRFSRYDCVNDISEGSHILECYNSVCTKLYNNNVISKGFYDIAIDISSSFSFKRTFMFTDSTPYTSSYTPYICCFSTNRDSLPMWNYYVKSNNYEGYNLRFSDTMFDSPVAICGFEYGISLHKVIYSLDEKEDILKKFMLILNKYYESQPNDKNIDKLVKSLMETFLENICLNYKNECFSHENEIRAILMLPSDKVCNIEFFTKKGLIIPYITLSFDKKMLEAITIAPLVEKNLSNRTVKKYLAEKGYDLKDDDIVNSGVPIRF